MVGLFSDVFLNFNQVNAPVATNAVLPTRPEVLLLVEDLDPAQVVSATPSKEVIYLFRLILLSTLTLPTSLFR